MKYSVLFLAILASSAYAQDCPTTYTVDPAWKFSIEPILNPMSPDFPQFRSNVAGMTVFWYNKPSGQPNREVNFVYLAASQATGMYLSDVIADVLTIGATQAQIKRQSLPSNDPLAMSIWCPWWPEMVRGMNVTGPSPDGTLVPPAASLTAADLAVWTIGAGGVAIRSGVPTNGHATAIILRGVDVYAKSPTGGIWWKYTGPNTWQKFTTVQP